MHAYDASRVGATGLHLRTLSAAALHTRDRARWIGLFRNVRRLGKNGPRQPEEAAPRDVPGGRALCGPEPRSVPGARARRGAAGARLHGGLAAVDDVLPGRRLRGEATVAQSLFWRSTSSCTISSCSILANKLFSILVNLPLLFPFAIVFRTYHLLHHAQQGQVGYDMDLLSLLEQRAVRGPVTGRSGSRRSSSYALRPAR